MSAEKSGKGIFVTFLRYPSFFVKQKVGDLSVRLTEGQMAIDNDPPSPIFSINSNF
jgi:hypothetical protein